MTQRSRAGALLQYLATSTGWLILMAFWPLLAGPHADPRCQTSASFGFLPAAMVVPFLILLLYAISVALHAVFAFRRSRLAARPRVGVALFGLDAGFFVPFAAVSLIAYLPAMHWDSSVHCFFWTLAIALPWIITPVVNARLLAWTA